MKNLKNRGKKKLLIYLVVVIVFLGIGYAVYAQTSTEKDKSEAKNNNEAEQVNLLSLKDKKEDSSLIKTSGEVEAKQKIDLKSEVSAKVRGIYANLGQRVYRDQTLVVFENNDQFSRVQQAKANVKSAKARKDQLKSALESQKSKLRKLKSGPRPEKLKQARTKLKNAKSDLESARDSLEETKQKAKSDMQSKLFSALRSADNAVDVVKNTILTVTDIQYAHFDNNNQDSLDILDAKRKTIKYLFNKDNAGKWIKEYISTLDGGLYKDIDKALEEPDKQETKLILKKTLTGLKYAKNMLQVIPVNSEFSATDEQSLSSAKQKIQRQMETLSSKREAIDVQSSVNSSSIQKAKAEVKRTENAVNSAKDNLDLVKSGAEKEDIRSQKEAVEQAKSNLKNQQASIESSQANLLSAQSALSKTIIKSPINGTVSALEVDRGELVSPSQLVAKVINTSGYQLKVYLSSPAAKSIDVGNTTTIAGNYTGKVANISPSLDSQTNKVEVHVSLSERNPDLVAGEVVDVEIKKSQLNNNSVLLPIEAVSLTNEGNFVYTVSDENKVEKKKVTAEDIVGNNINVSSGLEGVDKIIASTRGLNPGDKVEFQ